MTFQELVYARHSVRKFTDEPVPREIIDTMIAEAQSAPSSKNCKSSAFMIIDEPDTISAISQMRSSGSAFVKDAKAVIVVLGDEETGKDMWIENAAISATYLHLAAAAHGLGSCWVQVRNRNRDNSPDAQSAEDYLRELLGIKENFRVLCVLALGYEAKSI